MYQTLQTTADWATQTQQKNGVNSYSPEGWAVPATPVAPVSILLNMMLAVYVEICVVKIFSIFQGITPSDNHVFPFTKDSVTKFMQDKKYIFDVSSLPPDFDRYFEVMLITGFDISILKLSKYFFSGKGINSSAKQDRYKI